MARYTRHTFPLSETLSLTTELGHMDFERGATLKDFAIVRLLLNTQIDTATLSIGYSDTTSEQFGGRASGRLFAELSTRW